MLICWFYCSRGGYEKPTVYDILWVQLTLSPYYLVCYIAWFLRWIWKFTICREEYGDEEREYLIRKKMKLSSLQWDVSRTVVYSLWQLQFIT